MTYILVHMKKSFIIILAIGIFATAPSIAQSAFSIQYSMGFGSGDVKSFISSSSFRGAAVEYRYLVQPKIGIGADIGWNTFYERRAFDTYTSGTVSLSGVQYRYINAMPIYAAFDYYMKPGEKLNPFVGLGVGTLYTKRNTDINLYTIENSVWAFGLRPEAGVLVNANPGLDIILVGKYNYGFAAGGLDAQSYFTFNVGLRFKGN
jgi:opacity protein-like surface antigen